MAATLDDVEDHLVVTLGSDEKVLTSLHVILLDTYLEGWSPGDDGLDQVLLAAARSAGNSISLKHESACSRALGSAFAEFTESLA